MPSYEFGLMMVKNGKELVVVYVPESSTGLVLAQESEVSEQLAKAGIRRQLARFPNHGQGLMLGRWNHGNRSLIFGPAQQARRNRPMISTRAVVPGASLAIRVALVTPL